MTRPKQLLVLLVACVGALAFVMFVLPRGRTAPPEAELDATRPSAESASIDSLVDSSVQVATRGEKRGEAVEPLPGTEPTNASQTGRLVKAKDELASHALASLDGVLYINEVLDQLMEFASLPVAPHPDLEYEDNDAIAYKLEGAPEGIDARLLVGIQPYEEDDKTFRYLQLRVDSLAKPEFLRDAMRDGPAVSLSISYDVRDKNKPTRFALMVQRRVALAESREAGIDAYSGQFTSGALFGIDLLRDAHNPTTRTFGIINGQPADTARFSGISPLAGDINLDLDRLAALLKQLQQHLSTIKGE